MNFVDDLALCRARTLFARGFARAGVVPVPNLGFAPGALLEGVRMDILRCPFHWLLGLLLFVLVSTSMFLMVANFLKRSGHL